MLTSICVRYTSQIVSWTPVRLHLSPVANVTSARVLWRLSWMKWPKQKWNVFQSGFRPSTYCSLYCFHGLGSTQTCFKSRNSFSLFSAANLQLMFINQPNIFSGKSRSQICMSERWRILCLRPSVKFRLFGVRCARVDCWRLWIVRRELGYAATQMWDSSLAPALENCTIQIITYFTCVSSLQFFSSFSLIWHTCASPEGHTRHDFWDISCASLSHWVLQAPVTSRRLNSQGTLIEKTLVFSTDVKRIRPRGWRHQRCNPHMLLEVLAAFSTSVCLKICRDGTWKITCSSGGDFYQRFSLTRRQ